MLEFLASAGTLADVPTATQQAFLQKGVGATVVLKSVTRGLVFFRREVKRTLSKKFPLFCGFPFCKNLEICIMIVFSLFLIFHFCRHNSIPYFLPASCSILLFQFHFFLNGVRELGSLGPGCVVG